MENKNNKNTNLNKDKIKHDLLKEKYFIQQLGKYEQTKIFDTLSRVNKFPL